MTPATSGALSAAAEVLPLLYIFASGYLIHENPLLRLVYREHTGHALYFRVLVAGLLWQEGGVYLLEYSPEKVAFIAFLSYAGGVVIQRMIFLWGKGEIWFYRRSFQVSDDFFDAHILQAMRDSLQVMVTLDSGKVYMGMVESIRRRADAKWLALVPLSGGYRDGEKKLRFTTDYFDALANGVLDKREMLVTMPVDKIASLQFFDAGFHEYDKAPDDYRDSGG